MQKIPSVVLDPSLSSTSLPFLLLNSLNLWGLTSNLTSTSQGPVNFTSLQQDVDVNGQVVQKADAGWVLQDWAGTGKANGAGFNSLNLGNLNNVLVYEGYLCLQFNFSLDLFFSSNSEKIRKLISPKKYTN